MQRRNLQIEGLVQGVGFRPFVFGLAQRLGLAGWVLNNSRGVELEIEADVARLDAFERSLREELPPLAHISRLQVRPADPTGEAGFSIRHSEASASRRVQITPDAHVCDDCRRELFDPADRRYRYPFINCTNCGPRYSIVRDIPYDRANTTMVDFPMCPDCRREYEDPQDRRFHAQPNACPVCGPQLLLCDAAGRPMPCADPVAEVQRRLREGGIVAVKGIGGYHLAVDPATDAAVAELRRRKHRDEKPFALMARDLAAVRAMAEVEAAEAQLLQLAARPIVLLRRREDAAVSAAVAPCNRYLGVMLPGTPLHHLLLEGFDALIMTSGNRSDEPIAFEDADARARLAGIADLFLSHNRAIHIRTDDSIARLMAGAPMLLRRSRGYVPRAVYLPLELPPTLAVGAELKNTVCLLQDDRAFLSHHIGDLQNAETVASFEQAIAHLQGILEVRPEVLAHDLHPDYAATRYARSRTDLPRVAVQHHHAHLASCLAENGVTAAAIGIIFDGIGYGADGHIWGGEFLVGDFASYRRAGHFRYVPMPGGDAATREPGRMALSYLVQSHGADALPALPLLTEMPAAERKLLLQMLARGINSPLTSSAGRLFDAVAALCGLRGRVNYEGQAALELEQAIGPEDAAAEPYPVLLTATAAGLICDPSATVRAVVADVLAGEPTGRISARFHLGLAELVRQVCRRLREETGLEQVALSGGVFQNRFLTEAVAVRLAGEGFRVLRHGEVPPNDGGLALGQAVVAGWHLRQQL